MNTSYAILALSLYNDCETNSWKRYFSENHYGPFLSNLDNFRINECFCCMKCQWCIDKESSIWENAS